MSIIDELAGALVGIPDLPGAACVGRPEVFDLDASAEPEQINRARSICRRCPAWLECRTWVSNTPPHLRPSGVVAGRLQVPPAPPKARERRLQRKPRQPRDSLVPVVAEWLAQRLAAGPVPSMDVKFEASQKFGIADKGVISQAYRELGAESRRVGRCSYWSMPGAMPSGSLGDETRLHA